jgi:two-component system cell cycle sensor histidine kinase/response regulator CckA
MNKPIKILLIEDNAADVRLIQEMMGDTRASHIIEVAERLSSGISKLSKQDIDVVLLDLGLPDSGRLDTFTRVSAKAPRVPVVVLTGLNDEEIAVKAVSLGAQDYLVKGQINGPLLIRAIRYAIERKRMEEELRKYTERLEDMVMEKLSQLKTSPKPVAVTTKNL